MENLTYKDLESELIKAICERSEKIGHKLKPHDIKTKNIEDLEKELNIKTNPPKFYFGDHKLGYQPIYKFISKNEIENREKLLDNYLKE